MNSFNVFETDATIPLYYGIGGRITTGCGEDTRVGLRIVIGIGYIFRDAPYDMFVEAATVVDLAPSTELNGNGGIGARFILR
jgi:hypothetical protein